MFDRRAFLKNGGLALVTLGAGPAFLTRAAAAAPGARPFHRRKVLVTIFQRGAMDGLMAVQPLDDPHLASLRPRLHLRADRRADADRRTRDLGIGYGLHPAFDPLLPLWRDGHLAIVHGVGSPDPTRSHFDAQDFMESGTPGRKGTPDGWLNRVVGALGHDATPFRAVAMTPALPRSFYGDAPAVAVEDLSTFRVDLPGAAPLAASAGQGFEALYASAAEDLLRDTAADTFDAVATLDRLDVRAYRPAQGVDYPDSALGQAMRQIAFLIKSNVGLEVAFAESGGWDTHVRQGVGGGSFAARARDLAQSMMAFWRDLGAWRDDVTLMTMTEFGRTVAENGSAGTDHGHASCLFVVGGDVRGGQLYGGVPRLANRNLFEGRDLPMVVDFRAVFSAVARRRFDLADDVTLFPGWTGAGMIELFRA
ncbi:MAG: DUF1501 domain-containing protein [Acidobacteriota bacterium]